MVVESDPYQLVLQKLEEVKIINTRRIVLPDGVSIDFSKHIATKEDVRLNLTKTNWKILECLVGANGRTVSIETLCKHVWNDNYDVDEPHYLRVQISRLRSTLGYSCIETIGGIGYRLCLK